MHFLLRFDDFLLRFFIESVTINKFVKMVTISEGLTGGYRMLTIYVVYRRILKSFGGLGGGSGFE